VAAALSEMNYDAKKMPLGKLAKSTLTQGFAALKVRYFLLRFAVVLDASLQELAEVINDPQGATAKQYGNSTKAYEQLSGRYYSSVTFVMLESCISTLA
jgi:poly [ADP-ribose] polymerase 2/3/4